MIVAESSRPRRLVGRLDPGADLLLQLSDICRSHRVVAGEARAGGVIDQVVLAQHRLDGAFELVTFRASIEGGTLEAAATLSRDGGALLGGRLSGARVVRCEFVIDAFDAEPAATQPTVAPPAVAQAAVAEEPLGRAPKPVPMFDPPARTSWSDVVAASERRVAPVATIDADEPDEEPAPAAAEVLVQPGDFIDHPKFGRCQVEKVDGDHEFVSARLRNQRLIRLSLDVLTLIPAGQENGRNLFRAVAGK